MAKTTTLLDANGREVEPEALYICNETFVCAVPGEPFDVGARQGVRHPGSHPLVQVQPLYWFKDGDEVPRPAWVRASHAALGEAG